MQHGFQKVLSFEWMFWAADTMEHGRGFLLLVTLTSSGEEAAGGEGQLAFTLHWEAGVGEKVP